MNQNVLDRKKVIGQSIRGKNAIEHILVHETSVLLRSEKSLRLFVDKVFKNCFVKKAVL